MSFSNDDILVLAKAGFNAQQIAALNNVSLHAGAGVPSQTPSSENNNPAPAVSNNVVTPPVSNQTPVVNTQTAPTPVVNNQTAPVNQTPAQGATIDDVLGAISGLSDAFKLGNLQIMQQPTPPTAEDILAEIINPPTTPKN